MNETDRLAGLPGLLEEMLRRAAEDIDYADIFYNHLPRNDVRRCALHKLVNALVPAHLGLLLLAESLLDAAWWVLPGRSLYTPGSMPIVLEEFERHFKASVLVFSFSATESSFRSLVRALSPGSCNDGTAAFKSIYTFLAKLLATFPPDALNTLELHRLMRNAIHNNAVHFHHGKGPQDQEVLWKGESFKFEHGQPIAFLTWELMTSLWDEVRALTRVVITDPMVQNYSGLILEPYTSEEVELQCEA